MSKLLTVFGATGNQGGSVIKSVLQHPVLSKEFKIRGITRDPSKPSGQELAKKGVEPVKGDMDDKESLRLAIKDSHTVFLVTNFWEKCSKEIEVQQGKNVADICKELNVQHLIFSSLPNTTELSNGKLPNIKHFDGKSDIDAYIRKLGVPMTSFQAGFYMSNFKDMFQKGEDGVYNLSVPIPPSTKIPLIDIENDTGKFVSAIILKRSSLLNATVLGATYYISIEEAAKIVVEGKPLKCLEVSGDIWKSFMPEHMAQEMLENYYLVRDYKYYGLDGEERLQESLKLLEEPPTTVEEYVKRDAPLAHLL